MSATKRMKDASIRFDAQVLFIFVLSCVLIFLLMNRYVWNVFDEGIILTGAQNILLGRQPYRDFWIPYGPGQFWTVAALFKIFGSSIAVERAWDTFVRAALATLVFTCSYNSSSRYARYLAWFFTVGWLCAAESYGIALYPAVLFGLLSAFVLASYVNQPNRPFMPIASGGLAGLSLLFRHDIGALAAAAGVATTLFAPLIFRLRLQSGRQELQVSPVRTAALIALGFAGATVIPVAYLLVNVPVSDLWNQLVIFPSTMYVPYRSLPFPSIMIPIQSLLSGGPIWDLVRVSNDVAIYFPWVFGIIVACYIMWLLFRGPRAGVTFPDFFLLVLMAFLIIGFCVKGSVRPAPKDAVPAMIPCIILLSRAISGEAIRSHRLADVVIAILLLPLAISPAAYARSGAASLVRRIAYEFQPAGALLSTGAVADGQNTAEEELSAARNFRFNENQALAVFYVINHTQENDYIFVANGRNDRTVITDLLFYFVAQRRPATKHYELEPGVTTTDQVQASMIQEFRVTPPSLVVICTTYDASEPMHGSGSTRLDRYIADTYRKVAQFGDYQIWAPPVQ